MWWDIKCWRINLFVVCEMGEKFLMDGGGGGGGYGGMGAPPQLQTQMQMQPQLQMFWQQQFQEMEQVNGTILMPGST